MDMVEREIRKPVAQSTQQNRRSKTHEPLAERIVSSESIKIINPNAGRNKGNGAERERDSYRHILCEGNIHITTEEEMVKDISSDLLENPTSMILTSGGDGTVHKFLREFFLVNYDCFGGGMTLIEFGHQLNRLALDLQSGVNIPCLCPIPRGTVNFLAKLCGINEDKRKIAENLMRARQNPGEVTRVLDVVYIPVLMMYSKERPHDPEHVQLMTVYGDGFTFRSVDEYERFKENWIGPKMGAALKVVAKGSISAAIGLMLDKISTSIYGSAEKSRGLYPNRFGDMLAEPIEGEVKVDGRTLPTDKRTMTLIGTHWMDSQGIKPFWRMPRHAKDMKTYFPAGVPVNPDLLDPKDYTFHSICGNPTAMDIVVGVPWFFSGRQTYMRGIHDVEAKRVEMQKKEPYSIIAGGTRHHELPVGDTIVIEIAYLQPFAMLG